MLARLIKITGFLIVILQITILSGWADQNPPCHTAIENYVSPTVQNDYIKAVSIGYIKNGRIGFVNLGIKGTDRDPVDENTLYEIGSITKTFTATILADMAEKKDVRLEMPVQELLPDNVRVPKYKDKEITLLHLVQHNSGLPRMPSNFKPADLENPYVDCTVKQLYEFLNDYKMQRAPEADYEYSNLGAGLLGHALSLKVGKSYQALLAEKITTPLEMKDTVITLSKEQQSRFAQGHDYENEPTKHWDIQTLEAAGAIRSTTKDMVRYLQAQMGLIKTPLAEAIKMTHSPRVSTNSKRHDLAMAWHVRKKDGAFWHNGGTGGFHSFCIFDEKSKTAVVVLSNTATFFVDKIGWGVFDILTDNDPMVLNSRKTANIDPETMKKYQGTYKLSSKLKFEFYLKNGKWYSKATGQGEVRLYPESETVLFAKVVDARFEFIMDKKGRVKKFILHQNGETYPAKKIK